jgi:hypothetical protein
LRHTSDTTEFPVRRNGDDNTSITRQSLRTSDCEEWIWMVDEDPAFYLSKPGGSEAAGA